jgi:O-antigen/teichoic acid export membrane protein
MAAVGYYSAPHELIMRMTLLPASMVATLFPALSMAVRLEERDRIHRFVAGSIKFLLIVAGPVLVTLAVLAPDILTLYLGPSFARESGLALRILAAGMLINALTYVANVLLQAVGRPDLPAKFHLFELPVHVVLLWLCIDAWGIAGAAAAWTDRMVLDSLLLFGASRRLGLLSWRAFREMKVPATAGLLIVLGVLLGLTVLVVTDLGVRLAVVAVLLVGAGATAWTALLDVDDKKRLVLAVRPGR